MTINEYLNLTNEEQWDYLWDHGSHVDNYKSIDCSFLLYSVHTFYVEVELCVTSDKILGMSPFEEGKRLDKYRD